ncbi:MAG: hypothetical protein ABIP94_02610, partial [Planctomycetota bacterium]
VLAKAPKAALEMEANLLRGEQRLPVTISPYTIVEGVGRGGKSPRVGVPGKADIDRVQKGYESYAELSKSINQLKGLAKDEKQLRKLATQLALAIKQAASNLKAGLQDRLNTIVSGDAAKLGAIHAAAKALKDELEALQATWKTFADGAPAADPITLARSVSTLARQLEAPSLQTKITTFVDSLAGIPVDLDLATKELLRDTGQQLAKEKDALLGVLKGVPGVGGLANALSALQSLAQTQTFGGLEPGTITSNPMGLGLAEAGVVDLDQTPAEAGDRLEVTYRLTNNPNALEADQRKYVSHESLDVRKFGYYSTLKSQILFYDRLHDGSSIYSAAPGISYNLHYRPNEAQGFCDVVAPGLGVSVSAPNFENGTELAIGAQLTLFNDMVQIGYAYNISVDDRHEMFFFGLDLISVFQGLK